MLMRESAIERDDIRRIRAAGGMAYKFTSPGRRNVPDRLVLYPIPQELQAIVGRYIQFFEYKAPGRKPRPGQEREIARLRYLGFKVEVIDGQE